MPHEALQFFFIFPFAPVEPPFVAGPLYISFSFMSNILREVFVENHVQQVRECVKETAPLGRKFQISYVASTVRVKIFAFFKKVFLN